MIPPQVALDRLAEHYGPSGDPTHPLFRALWEPCQRTWDSYAKEWRDICCRCGGSGYIRRSRAEAVMRLLSAAKAAGYRGIAISMNDDGSWEAEIEGTISPPTGASICNADDPYEALAAALLAAEAKP